MKAFFRLHLLSFLFAALVGLLIWSPTYFATRSLGGEYQGVPFLYQDNEDTYLARIHEIIDGHSTVSSPMLADYKDSTAPVLPFGEYIYAIMVFAGLPIQFVVIFSKFFLPAILFLLIYFFVFSLLSDGTETKDARISALSCGALILLGYDIVDMGRVLGVFSGSSASVYLSPWSRLVNPVTGAIFLFAYLISLWKILEGRNRFFVVAGFLLAGMSGYIFSFGLALIVAFLVVLLCLIQKKYTEALACVGNVFLGIVLNFSYWYRVLGLSATGAGLTESLRNGLFFTHEPLLNKVLLITFFLFVLASFFLVKDKKTILEKKENLPLVFSFLLLLAGFIVLNQQIVTGKTVWPQHFVQYTIPFSFISIFVLAHFFLRSRFRSLWICFVTLVSGIAVLFTFCSIGTYRNVQRDFLDTQRYAPLLRYLNERAQPDCAVLVKEKVERIARLIPALTSCNVYMTSYNFIGIPLERIEKNYLIYLRLNDVQASSIESYLKDIRTEMRIALFRDWKDMFRHTNNSWLIRISDREAIDAFFEVRAKEIANKYRDFVKKDFYTELAKNKIDYLVYDSKNGEMVSYPFLSLVFAENGIQMYTLNAKNLR